MIESEFFSKGNKQTDKNPTFTALEKKQSICPTWQNVGYTVFMKLSNWSQIENDGAMQM